MKLQTEYQTYDNVAIEKGEYPNGNLALVIGDIDLQEEIANLTVNLDGILMPNQAYVDTNNFPEGEQFIKENGLGEPTGIMGQSGFCEYPLYNFDLGKIAELEVK